MSFLDKVLMQSGQTFLEDELRAAIWQRVRLLNLIEMELYKQINQSSAEQSRVETTTKILS